MKKELHEQNCWSWNEATKAHNSHRGDRAKFFREGGSTLFPKQMELLEDISRLSLLHLQCNAGQDFTEEKPLTEEDGIGDYVADSSGGLTP